MREHRHISTWLVATLTLWGFSIVSIVDAEIAHAAGSTDDAAATAENTANAKHAANTNTVDEDAPDKPVDADLSTTTDSDATDSKSEPPSIDDLPWELRPYRILISIAFADRAAMGDEFSRSTVRSLERLIAGAVGPYWHPTIEVNDWLYPQTSAGIRQLTSERLSERFGPTEYDKVMSVVVEADGPGYGLTGCEWDRMTEQRGPTVQRPIIDRRRVTAVLFESLRNMFRPIAEIELAEESTNELRVRGGELLSPESPMFPFQTGDLLTPHFRYLDRDRKVRQIQSVPWTYLRIESINRSRMTAGIESPFASPLSGSRRRVELIAVRVEPVYSETRLSLSPRTNPGQPLVGVRVRVYESLPSEENPEPDRIDLMTDRSGNVTVPSYPEAPLRRLIVHSGGAVLSNVPFVPGIDEALSMELPDDSPRLQVEGNLAMVQGDLIDVVSRRAVMLARAVSLAKQEKFEEVDRLLAEVDAQPSLASFESRILAIRVPAVDRARANRDRSQEKRIRMMCAELVDLAEKYLDRDNVKEAKDEVSELKKLAGK